MRTVALIMSCILLGVLHSGAVHTRKRHVDSDSGSYSNSYRGDDANNYNHNDYDDFGYAPNFFDPFNFHQQLTAQILAQQAAQFRSIASTNAMGDATVMAVASNLPNELQDNNSELFDHLRRQNNFHHNDDKSDRYAPNYAAAAASLGPDGGHHSVFISPENPDMPNISNRFSPTGPGNFKGVSVSSYSTSSNINGKKSSHREAQATVNDNGRITTYKLES